MGCKQFFVIASDSRGKQQVYGDCFWLSVMLLGQSVNTLSLGEKAGLEGVSRCAVDVVAVLHDAPRGVVGGALSRQ